MKLCAWNIFNIDGTFLQKGYARSLEGIEQAVWNGNYNIQFQQKTFD